MGRGRSEKSIALVETAREILAEIQPCSVRSVCYQCFIRGVISGMDKANTNRVGALLTRAREEGEIPWGMDRPGGAGDRERLLVGLPRFVRAGSPGIVPAQ
jgi:hypothetical protein